MRRGRSLRTVLIAVALLSTGCASSVTTQPPGPDGPDSGLSEQAAVSPLTGLPADGDPEPIVVVKIDNTDAAMPQLGLDQADLIVEELVEGGMTRLAAFYHSDFPAEAGPVRSMRASDIPIVLPTGGTVVTSGAAAVTEKLLDEVGVDYVEERDGGGVGFSRDPERPQPYDLISDVAEIAPTLPPANSDVPNYLPWGSGEGFAELSGATPASSAFARFSSGHTTRWSFDGEHWVRSGEQAGPAFAADSVLFLAVVEGDAGYLDPAGNKVPETELTGTGSALLLHGDAVVEAEWSKGDAADPLGLALSDGSDLTVPAGRVWVELVPNEEEFGVE